MNTVTFYSPGTITPEKTTVETELTNLYEIAELARDIQERHGATPFGFRVEGRPGLVYLGGIIKTLEDIPDTPENTILRWNMKHNGIERVLENTNSWKHTVALSDADVVLAWEVN